MKNVKQLTFSLTCLVTLLALVFAPAASAHFVKDTEHGHFGASLKAGELMNDVSTTDHKDIEDIQIESGRGRGSAYPTAIAAGPFDPTVGTGPAIIFSISFDRVVQLHNDTSDTVTPSQSALGLDDFAVDAFDDLGRSLGTLSLDLKTQADGTISPTATNNTTPIALLEYATPRAVSVRDPVENPGRQFLLKIRNIALRNAYGSGGGAFEIHYLYITMKPAAVADASPGVIQKIRSTVGDEKPFTPDTSPEKPLFIRVDLVEEDEGFAQYANITSTSAATAAASGVPGVVAISRVDAQSGITPTATGPFDVRIILTEMPKEFKAANIGVLNGTASDPVALLPIPAAQLSNTNFPLLGYAAKGDDNFTPDTNATEGNPPLDLTPFPHPTGRDNMYHLYKVTITPKIDFTGRTHIWVKSFEDKVLPVADTNMYHALTEQLLVADTLTGTAEAARDTRAKNGREVLSVPVQTGKDTTADALTVEYEKRVNSDDNIEGKQGSFDKHPSLKEIPAGLVIPANGYLVLASGKEDTSGIQNSPAKVNSKLTAAQKAYNVKYEFTLPFPAKDLSTFFRNGGTLNLAYADIALATTAKDAKGNQIAGPSHSKGDDGKKVPDTAHADYTGYAGANSTAYAAGSVIINEIMWGLDAGLTTSQYIELHNTTSADIGIDKHEWVIAVGSIPSDAALPTFTTLDTVSNDETSTTEYWQVPGDSGVTTASPASPTISDLVSMARVDGTASTGTAASSWVASALPSANLSGARFGTPGADNGKVADTPAPTPPKTPTPPAKAPVAKSGDVMISEIMVASNGGRLPQWIELANVSGAPVSLMGWTAVINNDPADADVVGSSVSLDLGDVTIGKDQVALVVSKAGRSSGEGTGKGDLRSDRIIDVQAQVSPGAARYILISEMATKITLVAPPATGGVIVNADVVGNLGMGWELPMAEDGRSSLIRREMGKTAEIMGTDAAAWSLASDTMLDGAYRETYYGQASDVGTPGYDAGGALPVELSKFNAARDRVTGQVTITWETQSELNNAGFFIKRSQQQNGQFQIVNPTMIAGAGTISEKQSYTYTDTTAQPNIVYYYQIEDVSLDGQRQTLTRAHRLKGHVGAAGKATTTWGELKTSHTQ